MESTEIGRLNVFEESFDEDSDDEFDEGPDEDNEWYWDDATMLLTPPPGSGRTIVDELVSVLRKVTEFGCYCVIVSPAKADDDRVFVQCIATPAGFHIEAVSNVFLWDHPEKLDDQQHALLEALGWTEPTVPYDPADRPEDWNTGDHTRNWWAAAGGDDATERTAALMLHTLISVYRLGGEPVLQVRTFQSSNQDYEWSDELGELV
jgi:hypothetical protein